MENKVMWASVTIISAVIIASATFGGQIYIANSNYHNNINIRQVKISIHAQNFSESLNSLLGNLSSRYSPTDSIKFLNTNTAVSKISQAGLYLEFYLTFPIYTQSGFIVNNSRFDAFQIHLPNYQTISYEILNSTNNSIIGNGTILEVFGTDHFLTLTPSFTVQSSSSVAFSSNNYTITLSLPEETFTGNLALEAYGNIFTRVVT